MCQLTSYEYEINWHLSLYVLVSCMNDCIISRVGFFFLYLYISSGSLHFSFESYWSLNVINLLETNAHALTILNTVATRSYLRNCPLFSYGRV